MGELTHLLRHENETLRARLAAQDVVERNERLRIMQLIDDAELPPSGLTYLGGEPVSESQFDAVCIFLMELIEPGNARAVVAEIEEEES